MHRLATIFSVIFYLLTLAPHAYTLLIPGKRSQLGGVEAISTPPLLSLSGFWNGTFVSEFDSWFARHIGFRGELIRTDNQINFTVFREISAQMSSPVVLGADNFLFEKSYLDAYNNRNRVPDEQLDKLVRDLAELQALLKRRNITLLVLVSPNKVVFHQEKIPLRFLRQERDSSQRNMEALRPKLKSANINTLDTPEFFRGRSTEHFPLFTRGGTHWSYFGACLVTSEMMRMFQELSGQILKQVDCSDPAVSSVPKLTDKDLAELINIWSLKPFYQQLGYPRPVAQTNPAAKRPKLVFVGSSFLWTVLHYIKRFGVTADYRMLYYYQTMHRQRGAKVPIAGGTLDWEALLQNTDGIVLESNEAAIEGLGYGFIQDALNYLRVAT